MIRTPGIAIGASFACEKLLFPLTELIEKYLLNFQPELQWIEYGKLSTAALVSADCYVFLLRVEDFAYDHPEFRSSSSSVSTLELRSNLDAWFRAIYPQIQDRHSIIMFCPSPTPAYLSLETHFIASVKEELDSPKTIQFVPSTAVLDHFGLEFSRHYLPVLDEAMHLPYSDTMFGALALVISRVLSRFYRSSESMIKVVVLDCDNTLWKGVAAEDDQVEISPPFQYLQQFMKTLKSEQGLLLCLCSKNHPQDVHKVFESRTPGMILSLEDDIVASAINWQPKSINLKTLAKTLNLSLDSFVFIDDNPIECHEVAVNCPQVHVLQLPPNEDDIPQLLRTHWVFDRPVDLPFTREDSERTRLYKANVEREFAAKEALSSDAFLANLAVQVQIDQIHSMQANEEAHVTQARDRVFQLLQRTNQFNASSYRYTWSEFRELLQQESTEVYGVRVTDRFGCYGCVGVFILELNDIRVPAFLLSCRVLNRKIEYQMLTFIRERFLKMKLPASELQIVFKKTPKNLPAQLFLASMASLTCGSAYSYYALPLESTALGLSKRTKWKYLEWYLLWVWHLCLQLYSRIFPARLKPSLSSRDLLLTRPISTEQQIEQLLVPTPHESSDTYDKFHAIQSQLASTRHLDHHESSKYRRKFRHQAKLLAHDPDEIIWSANGDHDVPVEVICSPLTCSFAKCSNSISLQCSLECCKTCCYKVQRLLVRMQHGTSVQAQESALSILSTQTRLTSQQIQTSQGLVARSSDVVLCELHQKQRA